MCERKEQKLSKKGQSLMLCNLYASYEIGDMTQPSPTWKAIRLSRPLSCRPPDCRESNKVGGFSIMRQKVMQLS
jgi:hypothetical protein